MKEKNKLKIVIILVITIILIASVVACVIMFSKGKAKENNEVAHSLESVEEPEISSQAREQAMNSDFALKFLKLENNKQNMIYSPLSIKYALKMLEEGAAGKTKTQIESLIGNEILTKYENIDEVLSLANSLYIRDTYSQHIKENYKNTIHDKYNAEIKYDPFENANNINNWIEDKTLGIIKDMIQDDMVQNPDTEMLLINALAIDMEWEKPFDAEDTGGDEFYLADGTSMNATTMRQNTTSDSISYYKTDDVTALTMDLQEYNNTQLEFIAIMPKANLADYIETFAIDDFNTIINKSKLASTTRKGVDISIPRFEFEYNLGLKNDLINLGITDAFDLSLADFSNMSNNELYVSNAAHKANIEFTEKGVKAAAVTVIYMTCGMAVQTEQPVEITIDKPFLFVIRDKNTGEIWFVGTVYEPNAWEDDKVNYEYR